MARLEAYMNEDDLLERIHLLRRDHNLTNQQLTIMSNTSFESNELNDDIKTDNIDGNAGDKLISFFSADEPESRYIENLGLTHEQIEVYNYAMEHHHSLLYIDSPDMHGSHKTELKDMDYDEGTEIIDMNKVK